MFLSLSDIVRDFTLASRTSVELQELQQSFINTLISSIATNSAGNQLHTALHTYATSSLAYHVRAALSAPLASDGLASTLLFHKDESIIAQCLAGVDRKDVDSLAQRYKQAKTQAGYWSAAKLFNSLASITAGLGFVKF